MNARIIFFADCCLGRFFRPKTGAYRSQENNAFVILAHRDQKLICRQKSDRPRKGIGGGLFMLFIELQINLDTLMTATAKKEKTRSTLSISLDFRVVIGILEHLGASWSCEGKEFCRRTIQIQSRGA